MLSARTRRLPTPDIHPVEHPLTPMKLHSPSCDRNQEVIASHLDAILAPDACVWEIGCGTGQHCVYFGAHLPSRTWIPSDAPSSEAYLASTRAYVAESDLPNVYPPIAFDLLDNTPPAFPQQPTAIVSVNVIHIAPFEATTRLFERARDVLAPGDPVILYGPFRHRDRPFEPSNATFDRFLRERDPRSGIRVLDEVDEIARACGFAMQQVYDVPANNRIAWWRRDSHVPG